MSTSETISPCRPESFDGIVKNKLPGKLFFFYPSQVPLSCMYVLSTQERRNISLIENQLRQREQKHKPTIMSSSYACAEDGYFKRPHMTSIDGDKRSDSGWFYVGF